MAANNEQLTKLYLIYELKMGLNYYIHLTKFLRSVGYKNLAEITQRCEDSSNSSVMGVATVLDTVVILYNEQLTKLSLNYKLNIGLTKIYR